MSGGQDAARRETHASVSTIGAVIERMRAIEAGLPQADGVARFNDLYLAVTREVAVQAGREAFEDPRFLSRLDGVFADRYFAAVDAETGGEEVPPAWAPLFEARSRPRIAPIQFALAGMNAHINYDLCLALVETCAELEIAPEAGLPQHRDYLRVNGILERVEERVKERLASGLVGCTDEALGRLDDVLAMWSVARARDAAWAYAEVLWELRELPSLRESFLETLARIVGLAGRGLLLPTL
jgi:hypothetical protein